MQKQDPESVGTYDCVLIDDEGLVRQMWNLAAQQVNLRLLVLVDGDAFWRHAAQLQRTVPIYVDFNLPAQASGEHLAAQIAAAGFTNIHVQTGYDASTIGAAAWPWLKGTVGKDPPWL